MDKRKIEKSTEDNNKHMEQGSEFGGGIGKVCDDGTNRLSEL